MSELHNSIEDLNRSLFELENEHRYQPCPPLGSSLHTTVVAFNAKEQSNTLDKNEAANFPKLDEQGETPLVQPLAARIPFFGLIMSLLSVICFSLCSLIVKILPDLHALEILGIRSIFQIIFYLSAISIYRLPFFGIRGHRLDIALRAIFGGIAAISIYMSYRLIPLADASTIQFSAPMFVFILAYFILGEVITILQIFTGFLALIGVVFVSKPQFILKYLDPQHSIKVDYTGIILAIVAAVSTAFGMIMLRKLKQTPVHVVIFWFSLLTTVASFSALYAIDGFTMPRGWTTWAWLVAIGFCGIGDQLFMTLAFKYEQAGIVSVSRTMTIVLAFIWDTLLLGVSVHWTSILGSCLVITSVLLLGISKTIGGTRSAVVTKIFAKVNHTREKATVEERAKLLSHS